MPLVADISVNALAAGATLAVNHGLTDGLGNAILPTEVRPDRVTSITVVSATTTQVTFRNDGIAAATANFRCTRWHSVQAPTALSLFGWNGASGSGAGSYQVLHQLAAAQTINTAGATEYPGSVFTLPAQSLTTAGQALRFRASLDVNGDGVKTLSFGNMINGVAGAVIIPVFTPANGSRTAFVEFTFILRSTGSPGNFGFTKFQITDAQSGTGGVVGASATASTPVFDTEAAIAIGFYANWSAGGSAASLIEFEAALVSA